MCPGNPPSLPHPGTPTQTGADTRLLCTGEDCEEQGRIFTASCANSCPRACTDLWQHVECVQGGCKPGMAPPCTPPCVHPPRHLQHHGAIPPHCPAGCRCPQGQLLQDGVCVPTAQCRCGLNGGNGTQELWPGQEATIECHNWWVSWGSRHGQDHAVPITEPQ